jgi:hypothetical protein
LHDEVPETDQPGAGALREYQRRLAARVRRGDGHLPAPDHEDAWLKGYVGERVFGEQLNSAALAAGGVAVLHDLVLPGARANVDHVIVGPAGISVVDAKAWGGRVWIGRDTIGQGRRSRRAHMDGLRGQVNRVHAILARAGRDDVPVQGLLCMVNANRGISAHRVHWLDGVGIGTMPRVIEHVMRPGTVGLDDVRGLHAVLAGAFTVGGGSIEPTEPRRAAPPAPVVVGPRRRVRVPRRQRHRPGGRFVLNAFAILLALTLLAGLVSAMTTVTPRALQHLQERTRPMSRHELDGRRAELRAVARRRAHGPVRGPRVVARSDAFTLVYRRGRRCRVILTVSRSPELFGRPPIAVRSTGCAKR